MDLNAEINVVSLIDVMMLLMVIFMITAPMMQGGVDVNLPEADSRPLETNSGMVVTVHKDGRIFVDNDPNALSVREFGLSFKALAQNRIKDGVYLKGDQVASWGTMTNVMGIMTKAGVTKVMIVTEPEEPR